MDMYDYTDAINDIAGTAALHEKLESVEDDNYRLRKDLDSLERQHEILVGTVDKLLLALSLGAKMIRKEDGSYTAEVAK